MKLFLFIFLVFTSPLVFAVTVENYAVSVDKTKLALAYDDHIIRLHDLSSGKLLHELKSHENSIQTVNFNSDGSRLISGDWGEYAIIWDVDSGQIIKKKNMGETVMHASYSANDSYLVMAIDEQPLALYDKKLNKLKGTYAIGDLLQISLDRRVLVGAGLSSGDVDDNSVIIVDLINNTKRLEIPENSYDDEIYFSKDSSVLVVRDFSVLHVWNIKENKKITTITPKGDIDKLLINPINDNELWLTYGNKIEIWDYRTNTLLKRFLLKDYSVDSVNDIVFSADGKSVVIAAWLEPDVSKVLVINTQNFKVDWEIEPMSNKAFEMTFLDPDSLLINSAYPIEIWDMKNKKLKHLLTKTGTHTGENLQDIFRAEFSAYKFQGSINAIDVDDKGTLIVTGAESSNGSIALDDKGQLSNVFQNNYITGYDARYSNSGTLAAFAYHGEHLLIYNTSDGGLYTQLDLGGVPSGFRIIKFSQDDSLLAVGSDDGSVYIVDVKNKESIKHVEFLTDEEYSEGTFSLQWIDDKTLLVGTLEHVYELDVITGEFKKVWAFGATALHAYFEEGKMQYLVVGQYDDELIIVDSNYRKINTSDLIGVGRLAIASDGKKIIALTDYNVTIWNIENNTFQECKESENSLWAMAYDETKHTIYIGGDEGKVYIYDEGCKALN